MVEAVRVSLPNRDWLCRNCSEPLSKPTPPEQHACIACGDETVWELSEDACDEMVGSLEDANVGDELTISAEGPAPLQGIITDVSDNSVTFGSNPDNQRVVHYDPDDPSIPRLTQPAEDRALGHRIYYVDVVPERDIVEDTTVGRTIKTPIGEVIHDASSSAGLDPRTVEVEGASVIGEELHLRIRGERA